MAAATHENRYLSIYLNDHLAGAVVGVNLARRLATREHQWVGSDVLQRLATEVAEDRQALMDMMATLDVPIRHYKRWAAWATERIGRIKPNGHVVARSPLSRVLELEAMRLAVEGKAAGWRTLRTRAESDPRLDAPWLDRLNDRARRQIDVLENLRVQAVATGFGG